MELELQNISKKFKDKSVLSAISLRMENGVYGLLGPNGTGKTTMIKILADLLQPSQGKVLLNGRDKNEFGEEYRSKIGYLPQDMNFYSDFSGRDYLRYIAALKGVPDEVADREIERLASDVGLAKDLHRRCVTYSGGMKRRLGIAQALLNNPEILILDEPTSGLDPYERIKFRNIISAFSRDRLVLLSTHIVSDVDRIAKKIMMMENGKINSLKSAEEYVREMENRVWLLDIPDGELVAFQNTAVISNVVPKDNMMEVRVIDQKRPRPDALPVRPTLEDAYLYYFNYLPSQTSQPSTPSKAA